MSCFPCFSSKKEETNEDNNNIPVAEVKDARTPAPVAPVNTRPAQPPAGATTRKAEATPKKAEATTSNADTSDSDDDDNDPVILNEDGSVQSFTFREMAMATKNFKQECLLGESGFGRVFKGTLQSSGQIVAVRQLDRTGVQGSKEFLDDALALSKLHHQNLVSLIGYCADGDQRILVYEYIPSGSLEQHLFDISAGKKPLDWNVRMKIASGVAEGLEYLHEKANRPIIYRDLKSADIMLDEQYKPKLSGYGLAKIVQSGNKMNVSPRVVAGYGYSAPEYERRGELTFKSDVYSFGVVLLELITGRRAFDPTRPAVEQNLVSWAQPFFRDPKKFPDMADPLLENKFATTSLSQAVGAAAMCLQEEPSVRPLISDVVAALSFLAMAPPDAAVPARLVPLLSTRVDTVTQPGDNNFHKEDHLDNKQPQEHEDDDKSSSSDYEDSEDNKETEAKAELQHESSCKSRSSSASSDSHESRDDSPRFSLRESSFRHGSGSASPNARHEDDKKSHHDSDDSGSEDESYRLL